jgi:hypothetical protein
MLIQKRGTGYSRSSFLSKKPVLTRRLSGSFPEQSNIKNERYTIWRQINKTVYIYYILTESRLKNRTITEVAKKIRSLK